MLNLAEANVTENAGLVELVVTSCAQVCTFEVKARQITVTGDVLTEADIEAGIAATAYIDFNARANDDSRVVHFVIFLVKYIRAVFAANGAQQVNVDDVVNRHKSSLGWH